MTFWKRVLGRENAVSKPMPAAEVSPGGRAPGPDMIRVFDAYGREMQITRQDWRDKVLRGSLEKAWNDPDQLYNGIPNSPRPACRGSQWRPRPQTSPRSRSKDRLRIEQQLAVTGMHQESLRGGGLSGGREILDGALQLCLRRPDSLVARILYAQTLRQMRKVGPDVMPEYREKTDRLQREHAIAGDVGPLVAAALGEAFATSV